jgi:hypothetical protein
MLGSVWVCGWIAEVEEYGNSAMLCGLDRRLVQEKRRDVVRTEASASCGAGAVCGMGV